MNLDSNGLVISGGDGGDSCQRQYEIFLRLAILSKIGIAPIALPTNLASPAQAQALLEVKPGIYVRNPDPTQWYSNPNTTSRDQLTPPLCYHSYMSFHGDKDSRKTLGRLLWACIKRGMFAQNDRPDGGGNWKIPDFLDPSLWSIFLRGSKTASLLLYPLLMLGDFVQLIGTALSIWGPIITNGTLSFTSRDPNDVDDNNMNNVMNVAQYTIPTPFSWLSRKMYKKYRQQNDGNTQMGETSAIMGAMVWYDRLPAGNPEIPELARPIVERY